MRETTICLLKTVLWICVGLPLAGVVLGSIGAAYYFGWQWLGPCGVFLAFMLMFLIGWVAAILFAVVVSPILIPLTKAIERLESHD